MAGILYDTKTTDASNTSFAGNSTDINVAKPSDARKFMQAWQGASARWLADLGATATVSGTTALTVTLNQAFTAYGSSTGNIINGTVIAIKPPNACTGATTLNINSIGTKKIRAQGDSDVASGAWLANSTLLLRYDTAYDSAAGAWVLIGSSTTANPLSLSGSTVGYTPFQGISTEAAAAAGPIFERFRDSASPAVSDLIGSDEYYGRSSTAVKREYAALEAAIVDPTNAAERGSASFYTIQNGGRNLTLALGTSAYATTATAAGTTTLTKLSAPIQYFTGTTTQTVVLPAVTELFIGQRFIIENRSTGRVTVQSSGANTIQIMGGTFITFAPGAPGTTLIVTCISNSGTGTASWDFEYIQPTTAWVTYTPTFTGFGTATSISMWSRRVGDSLEIRGKFTSGTATAVEARISLGYNGTDSNVSSDSTKVASIQSTGSVIMFGASSGATPITPLIESGVGYMTFGLQGGSQVGLTKITGTTLENGANVTSFMASIPIANG